MEDKILSREQLEATPIGRRIMYILDTNEISLAEQVKIEIANKVYSNNTKGAEPKQKQNDLLKVKSIGFPQNMSFPTDAVTNEVFKMKDGESKEIIINSKKKTSIIACIEQVNNDIKGIELPDLDEFDKYIHAVLVSLYRHGYGENTPLSYDQIARFAKNVDTINDNSISEIIASIDKMASYQVVIPTTDEAREHKIPYPEGCIQGRFKGNLIYREAIEFIVSNQIAGGIKLLREPTLSRYIAWKSNGGAEQITKLNPNQILPKGYRRDKRTIAAISFLADRISRIKHANGKMSCRITLTSVVETLEPFRRFNKIPYEQMSAEQRKKSDINNNAKVISIVNKIFDGWIFSQFIKGYRKDKQGRTVVAWEIFITDEQLKIAQKEYCNDVITNNG